MQKLPFLGLQNVDKQVGRCPNIYMAAHANDDFYHVLVQVIMAHFCGWYAVLMSVVFSVQRQY